MFLELGWGRRGTKTQGAENPASASVKGNIESVWSAFQRLLCVIFFFFLLSLCKERALLPILSVVLGQHAEYSLI